MINTAPCRFACPSSKWSLPPASLIAYTFSVRLVFRLCSCVSVACFMSSCCTFNLSVEYAFLLHI
jgi:hypothetical protein